MTWPARRRAPSTRRSSGTPGLAAMHHSHAMSGHVLPVILSWHLGIALNDVAGAAKGALDPQEFWHAWARGELVTADLFDPSWDFWSATTKPIDKVRAEVGLAN